MRVIIPYATDDPKTRLADILPPVERSTFSRAMLADVLEAVRGAGEEPEVLATAPLDVTAHVTVDDRSLSTAVNSAIEETDGEVAVVMADVALATSATLERLFGVQGDVVIVPGRGGGTNALVVRKPEFRVDYHGTSYLDHLRAARRIGASVKVIDSYRLATDIDEPADLFELFLHGEGTAREWLVAAGFRLTEGDGRSTIERVY